MVYAKKLFFCDKHSLFISYFTLVNLFTIWRYFSRKNLLYKNIFVSLQQSSQAINLCKINKMSLCCQILRKCETGL